MQNFSAPQTKHVGPSCGTKISKILSHNFSQLWKVNSNPESLRVLTFITFIIKSLLACHDFSFNLLSFQWADWFRKDVYNVRYVHRLNLWKYINIQIL